MQPKKARGFPRFFLSYFLFRFLFLFCFFIVASLSFLLLSFNNKEKLFFSFFFSFKLPAHASLAGQATIASPPVCIM